MHPGTSATDKPAKKMEATPGRRGLFLFIRHYGNGKAASAAAESGVLIDRLRKKLPAGSFFVFRRRDCPEPAKDRGSGTGKAHSAGTSDFPLFL